MLDLKLNNLKNLIATFKKGVVVGFSAGVDSTVLTVITHQVLADRMLAVTVDSEVIPRSEIEAAQQLARQYGFPHYLLRFNLSDHPEVMENTLRRCYYCKKLIYKQLQDLAQSKGYQAVLDGSNTDDLGDFRPGREALTELGVFSPFEQQGFTKSEIREIAHRLGLSVWNKPSSACLASRIPFGISLTTKALHRIEQGEELLKKLGAKQVRLRDHFPLARIECPTEEWGLILQNRHKITKELKALTYSFVTLDLDGYQTGSFNPSSLML
ncbi:MAG TPA: ATP-dependent sacrificial sulfur transferase LarE [Firmicutes bacterium]|jgi:uncharacterized protein|nr:ATP-dependent sacrificial sulfur transferase LarE [Bacillota bacterium]